MEIEGRYQKGRASVDEYLEQTAIANPHVTIHYIDPEGQYIFMYEGALYGAPIYVRHEVVHNRYVVERLRSSDVPEARTAAEQILGKSPVALKVTLRSLRHARQLGSLEEVLNEEFRVSSASLTSHERGRRAFGCVAEQSIQRLCRRQPVSIPGHIRHGRRSVCGCERLQMAPNISV